MGFRPSALTQVGSSHESALITLPSVAALLFRFD